MCTEAKTTTLATEIDHSQRCKGMRLAMPHTIALVCLKGRDRFIFLNRVLGMAEKNIASYEFAQDICCQQ